MKIKNKPIFVIGKLRWYEDVQKDLIEQIEAVKTKGDKI
jgi:hypothetical protein